jgi:hypothetical protein
VSNLSDTLLRFLDILAACAALCCGFMTALLFVAAWHYEGSQAQLVDRIQGRKVNSKLDWYFLATVVSMAWLAARHW